MSFTSIRNLANHIALASHPLSVSDAVLRLSSWPQTKSVVMLACEYDLTEACLLECAYPLVCIKAVRIEKFFTFGTLTPFTVCKSIHSEMNNCREFLTLPFELACRRYHVGRLAHDVCRRIRSVDFYCSHIFLSLKRDTCK